MADDFEVGVLIPVPEPFRSSLARARWEAGDRQVLAVPPHLTLLPPRRQVGPGWREHLLTVAAATSPFVVGLRGTGTFRPVTQVVYAALAQGEGPMKELYERLRQGPGEYQASHPFHPHVTLGHDLPTPKLDELQEDWAGFEATFAVSSFSVFEFHADQIWREQDLFTFGAGAP